jgi:hypothetical protein
MERVRGCGIAAWRARDPAGMSGESVREMRKASGGNQVVKIDIDRQKIKRNLQEHCALAAWLISRLQKGAQAREQRKSRLALVDRISLAPRQSLALVEAEGRRFLIGTSQDGGPVFYALDESPGPASSMASSARPAKTRATRNAAGSSANASARVSW